jgi:hypothetical protein
MADPARHPWGQHLPARLRSLLLVAFVPLSALGGPILSSCAFAGDTTQSGDSASGHDTSRDEGDARLAGMRRRAEATNVYRLEDGSRTAPQLLAGPLLRYNDQPRRILDATLWGWGTVRAVHKLHEHALDEPRGYR